VVGNHFIGYNADAGVKAEDGAHLAIRKNQIKKNFGQGVLLVESSSAVVEGNELAENLKANIALGGSNSINTLIVENKVMRGGQEGIFMMQAEGA